MKLLRSRDGDFEFELVSQPLGTGRYGVCHRVINSNINLDDMVVKIMIDSRTAHETFNHIEHLLTHERIMRFCETPSLEALLIKTFISEDGKCCLLMPRAHGEELYELIESGRLSEIALHDKLTIAYHIAAGLETIHATDVIHADIADPNVIVDVTRARAFIIDIDGGGISYSLSPRVLGHYGEWMAPELQHQDTRDADQFSDRWSLAVVLHWIITGLSPFYFCDMNEIAKYRDSWPPAHLLSQDHEFAQWHHKILAQVEGLLDLFKLTFGQGQKEPAIRPSASEWKNAIVAELASEPRVLKRCPKCGYDNLWNSIYCQNEDCAAVLYSTPHKCISCRKLIPVNAQSCWNCGLRLANLYAPIAKRI